MKLVKLIAPVMLLALLGGCGDETDVLPRARALTDASVGIFCGMILAEHPGPKAQIFEKGRKDPVWFSAVRDALAYSRLPGEAKNVVALYVHDMGRADSWEAPQADGIWIDANEALFVVGSTRRGGMGMIEVVPFATATHAAAFAKDYGGTVVTYADIEPKYLFPDMDADVVFVQTE